MCILRCFETDRLSDIWFYSIRENADISHFSKLSNSPKQSIWIKGAEDKGYVLARIVPLTVFYWPLSIKQDFSPLRPGCTTPRHRVCGAAEDLPATHSSCGSQSLGRCVEIPLRRNRGSIWEWFSLITLICSGTSSSKCRQCWCLSPGKDWADPCPLGGLESSCCA